MSLRTFMIKQKTKFLGKTVVSNNKSEDKVKMPVINETNEVVINEINEAVINETNEVVINEINEAVINETNEVVINETNEAVNAPLSESDNTDPKVVLIEPNNELLIPPTGNWHAVAEAVVGLSHRRLEPPLPCQDAFCISIKPRVSLLVADGAGSAAVSEIGANAVVNACQRLLYTLDDQTSELLDHENEPDFIVSKRFALRLVKHAMGTLEDISKQYRRDIKDFRCTLLMLIMGKERLLWVKVGDGALVIEEKGELRTLGEAGKGEFANQTTFIDDKLTPDAVQFGIISSVYVSGLSAMSDGAAEKLVSNDGNRVANKMSEFFIQLRQDSLNRTQVTDFLHDKDAWRRTSGDDKCLALAAR